MTLYLTPMKHLMGALLVGLYMVLPVTSVQAQLENFDFTVIGDQGDLGTVSGEIVGLEPNGTSQPTEIIVTDLQVPPGSGGEGEPSLLTFYPAP